ncbi:hypothetical protein [uncultured Aquimarina sp.]|uniref:hypothetical protein n=1 Tax=uncultured Aquimarina sp. TaxID=575652 RepID=UPI002605F0EA|nr:hypothetical protein [uncultured Aquimarina sp.]
MEIILILFVIALIMTSLFLVYRLLKWCFAKKLRVTIISSIVLFICLSFVIHRMFFVNMEFIQSKVYPDLYLVKHAVEEKDSLHKAIKKIVKQNLIEHHQKADFKDSFQYSLRFYTYYKNWNPLAFGDSGTAYFIDNEEDLGGMIVEDLSMYPQYKLAIFTMTDCKNTNTSICGKLDYYENGYVLKTDIIKYNF